MAGELAMTMREVHEAARDVLHFWFSETPPSMHFEKDDELDAEIATRFGPLRTAIFGTGSSGWRDTADTLLAAVVVLDQFSRNIYRGRADAFAADALALELTKYALSMSWQFFVNEEKRSFLYMPLMHSENLGDQDESVRLFTELGIHDNLKFAKAHRDVIVRFGRFPSRNAALGRASTPEEADYLSQPGAGW